MTDQQRKTLRTLYDTYHLEKDDVFTTKNWTIITRSGIEKIQAIEKINVKFIPIAIETFPYFYEVDGKAKSILATHVTVKAIGEMEGVVVETFASASPMNTQSTYYVEMAEKRGLSRVVLKLTNLYQEGVFGEDEGVVDEPAGTPE